MNPLSVLTEVWNLDATLQMGVIWESSCCVHVCLNSSCPTTHHHWARQSAQTPKIHKSQNSKFAEMFFLARTHAQSPFQLDFQCKRWYAFNVVSLNSLTMRLTVPCLSPCCGLINHTGSDSPNHLHNIILSKLKQMERESCGTACVALSPQFSNGCNYFEQQSVSLVHITN